MRILFLTLEFRRDTLFSGNGVLSRSLVEALREQGNDVLVLCGVPEDKQEEGERCGGPKAGMPPAAGEKDVIFVALHVWKKLDRSSSWKQYAAGVAAHGSTVATFAPDVVVGVDWTAVEAFKLLPECVLALPLVYFNYRIFHVSSGVTLEDEAFYLEKEAGAMSRARSCVCLCSADRKILGKLCPLLPAYVLNPPLREDVRVLAESTAKENGGKKESRNLVTCCSRLSPEKRVSFFVDLMIKCADSLRKLSYVPCLIGSATDRLYAEEQVGRLKAAFPGNSSVVSDFLDPIGLATKFSSSIVNIHPALYEAYGMTIAEQAALGTASLMDSGGQIGCRELFDEQSCFTCDMRDLDEAALSLGAILEDKQLAIAVGNRARDKSLQWTAEAAAQKFEHICLEAQTS